MHYTASSVYRRQSSSLKQEGEKDPPRGSAFCLVFLKAEDPLCGLLHPPCVRTAIYLSFFFLISLPLSVTSSDTNSTSVIKKNPKQSYLGRGHLEDPGDGGSQAIVASYKILFSYTLLSGFNNPALAADQDTQLLG